jgi:hypothetical protein
VDWKNFDKGKGRGVEVYDKKPEEIGSVCLYNNSKIDILIDAFEDNALPIKKGHQAEQCECIASPPSNDPQNWFIAIETKYTDDLDSALEYYPDKMISQIISTIDYLRGKGVIDNHKMVYAIISFPELLLDFNSVLFTHVAKEEWSPTNLIVNNKIRIKGCNSANIISSKRIKLTD